MLCQRPDCENHAAAIAQLTGSESESQQWRRSRRGLNCDIYWFLVSELDANSAATNSMELKIGLAV